MLRWIVAGDLGRSEATCSGCGSGVLDAARRDSVATPCACLALMITCASAATTELDVRPRLQDKAICVKYTLECFLVVAVEIKFGSSSYTYSTCFQLMK